MPPKRSDANPYLKRAYKRRGINRYRRGTRQVIGKVRRFLPLAGFPDKKMCRLRYVESITMTIANQNANKYAYSTNSCYDPNNSGTGHQPYGFDQWALIYNHYKVMSSSIRLLTTSVASQTGAIYGIKVDDNATVAVDVNSLMEQKSSRYNIVNNQSAPSSLSYTWNLRKSMDPTDDNVSAVVTNSPVDQEFFIIYAATANPADTTSNQYITLQVQIDYIVQFSELRDFANS